MTALVFVMMNLLIRVDWRNSFTNADTWLSEVGSRKSLGQEGPDLRLYGHV